MGFSIVRPGLILVSVPVSLGTIPAGLWLDGGGSWSSREHQQVPAAAVSAPSQHIPVMPLWAPTMGTAKGLSWEEPSAHPAPRAPDPPGETNPSWSCWHGWGP